MKIDNFFLCMAYKNYVRLPASQVGSQGFLMLAEKASVVAQPLHTALKTSGAGFGKQQQNGKALSWQS